MPLAKKWTLVALAGLCLATLLALAAPLGWPFELFAHFRAQYAVAGAVLALLLAFLGSPRVATVAALVAAFHALPGFPRTVAGQPESVCGGPELTVLTANLQYSNDETQRFVDWLAANPADLVVLQEVTPAWARALESLPGYPERRLLVRDDPYGIGVLSRLPFESADALDFAGDGQPSLGGSLVVAGQPLRFLALHTHWPILPGLARARDRSLDAAAEWLRSGSSPALALGDFNLTPYSPVFGRFLSAAGLTDSLRGAWWQPTWRAGFWPLSLRIDHVLVSPGLCVERAEVGPGIGSDHRPVVVRLRLERNA